MQFIGTTATAWCRSKSVSSVRRRPTARPPKAPARTEASRFFYDADGQLVATEVFADGKRIGVTHADRAASVTPVELSVTAGGTYQSDTELYDFIAGLGIHRRPKVERYGADPLEVHLEGTFRFHRTAGVTTTDQTTVRFTADYNYVLPRLTLFTFTFTSRNLAANLRLNLEQAILGAKDYIRLDTGSMQGGVLFGEQGLDTKPLIARPQVALLVGEPFVE